PGGFGSRGVEGKIGAIDYTRRNNLPTLGLCLGLHCMTIEVLRHVGGLAGANSVEFDESCEHPVIATMPHQADIVAGKGDMGGTMRLGAYPAELAAGSLVAEAYGSTSVSERHRHRYEVNNAYREALTKAGFIISGTSPDGRLVEFVELERELHPFFVATQAHPELKSRPTRPHPLFTAFVGASM
ncbi:MAG TPA: gamma-glutamyl-gamma-aminobutyrate hydrolase family protein, partial [Phytomonospora sp.]